MCYVYHRVLQGGKEESIWRRRKCGAILADILAYIRLGVMQGNSLLCSFQLHNACFNKEIDIFSIYPVPSVFYFTFDTSKNS